MGIVESNNDNTKSNDNFFFMLSFFSFQYLRAYCRVIYADKPQ